MSQTLEQIRAKQRANSKKYHHEHKDNLEYKTKRKANWQRWYAQKKTESNNLNSEVISQTNTNDNLVQVSLFDESSIQTPDYVKLQLLKIKNISVREKLILNLRFGLDENKPQTLEEIANRLHISRQRVDQILNKVLTIKCEDAKQSKNLSEKVLDTTDDEPLSNFFFSKRTHNALTRAGIETKKQLINLKIRELFSIKKLGIKSAEELLIFFSSHPSWFEISETHGLEN